MLIRPLVTELIDECDYQTDENMKTHRYKYHGKLICNKILAVIDGRPKKMVIW